MLAGTRWRKDECKNIQMLCQVAERRSHQCGGSGQLKRFELSCLWTRVHQEASDQWTIWSESQYNVVQWAEDLFEEQTSRHWLTLKFLVSWYSWWAKPVSSMYLLCVVKFLCWKQNETSATKICQFRKQYKIYDRLWHHWDVCCSTFTRKTKELISTYILDNICLICISIYIHLGLI